jgi:hypothetical protein
MDERIIQTLENLIYEKIILYNDLLHCLEKERETLIKIDMDDLWEISKKRRNMLQGKCRSTGDHFNPGS